MDTDGNRKEGILTEANEGNEEGGHGSRRPSSCWQRDATATRRRGRLRRGLWFVDHGPDDGGGDEVHKGEGPEDRRVMAVLGKPANDEGGEEDAEEAERAGQAEGSGDGVPGHEIGRQGQNGGGGGLMRKGADAEKEQRQLNSRRGEREQREDHRDARNSD